MATDMRALLAGLEEYHRILGRHLSVVTAEFDQVGNAWSHFSSVYEGEGADQFKTGWERTSRRFQEYISETQKISSVLDKSIEDLRAADRTESGLI